MSYIYSQALVAAFLPGSCSDTEPSAPSSWSPTLKPCLWHDRTMEPSRLSRFGMTCRPLTEDLGAELLTSLQGGFLARTSALPEKARDLTASAAECGTTWPGSLAKYDPDTHSLKTAQHSLFADLTECSPTLPRSGLMRNGECWERPMLARRTSATGFGLWRTPSANVIEAKSTVVKLTGRTPQDPQVGLADQVMAAERGVWPTPTVCGNYNRKGSSARSGDGLATAVSQRIYPTATATACKGWSQNHNRADTDDRLDSTIEREGFSPGQQTPPKRLNPDWVEWLMGWPIGQTELKPLAMDRFREWRQQHGGF